VRFESSRVQNCACQKPKELGYSYELWTYRLLQAKAQQAKQYQAGSFGSSKVASAQTTVRNTDSKGKLPNDVAQRIAALKQRKVPQPISTGSISTPTNRSG
jgi:hypothetical protein